MRTRLALLVILSLVFASNIPQTAALNVTWLPPSRITNDQYYDSRPSLIQRSDGTLLIAYSSTRGTAVDLYTRIYNQATGWSSEYRLTNGPGQNVAPSLVQLRNGTVLIAWASSRSGVADVYLAQTDGTSLWGTTLMAGDTSYEDTLPSIVVQKYGTIWLFWVRIYPTSDQIFYKTNTNGIWSNEALLVNNGLNLNPDALVTRDDKIILAWQRQNSGSDWEIYLTSYGSGQWSASWTRITQSSALDADPDLSQDRDGNVWIMWSREFQITGQTYQDELMSNYSTDNGATFPSSRETRITNDPSGKEKDDREPSVAQAYDRTLWLAYKSDPENSTTGNMPFDIWSMRSSVITTHNIAVGSIIASPAAAGQGRDVTVTVKVQNLGDYSETTTVRLWARLGATEYSLGTATLTLSAGVTSNLPFNFPTGTYPLGKYTFRATVTSVSGETTPNLGDNELVDGSLNLTRPQDVDHDGDIDIDDLAAVYLHMFTSDPNYDVNFDGAVDLADLISVYLNMFT